MLGRIADFFRLWWALLYWNSRKSWFQARRGAARCPCQSPSDSGRALETQCDACTSWDRPARFARVCPLLVATPAGLRCSANTADVRPFWGRAFLWYGGAATAIYLTAVLSVFTFLRVIGYPVSIVHVGLPPLWHKVGQARGWFFLERSHQAFAAGKTAEGLLYLANSYQFDPTNYIAGLSLAKNLQAGQPGRSDQVYEQLLRDHPNRRSGTAQDWFRALLARGSYAKIAPLARDELLADARFGGVWLRALLFATRRTGDDALLRAVLASPRAEAKPWRQVIETELMLRSGQRTAAKAALAADWPAGLPPFALFYRVATLIELQEPLAAMDLLEKHRRELEDEAAVTLRLDAYAASKARNLRQQQIDLLLSARLDPPRIKTLCAHLIRYPDAEIFEQVWRRFSREPLALDNDSAGAWFALLCTAGAVGNRDRLHELTAYLKKASSTPFVALTAVEAFLRGETAERSISTFLPILPLPLEVTYALLERYPAPTSKLPPTAPAGPAKP